MIFALCSIVQDIIFNFGWARKNEIKVTVEVKDLFTIYNGVMGILALMLRD